MTQKKTKKKTKKKNLDLKNVSPPVKVTFSHKQNPEFEIALDQEAARAAAKQKAEEEKKQAEIEDYIDPEKSRGSEQVPELSTIPFNAQKAVSPILKIPFSIWANIAEIPAIKLSDKEAEDWANPIVGLLEYYFPGKVPEIAWIWLMFATSTAHVIDSRFEIQHEHKEGSAAPHAEEPGEGRIPVQVQPRHSGSEPTLTFPQAG